MRGGSKINKTSYEYARSERVDWLDAFAEEYSKTEGAAKSAVEVARERSQQSVYEQISSIVGNVSHHTVDSKIKEMQDRTGLTEYLKRASEGPSEGPAVNKPFSRFGPKMEEDILNFCKNKIQAHRANIPVSALQYDLFATFSQQGLQMADVRTPQVLRYLSNLIAEQSRLSPQSEMSNSSLGLVDNDSKDDGNADVFKGLMSSD